MNYKGFEIKIEEYIEKRHPQYNYLGFTARRGEKYLNAIFHDLDMRLKSKNELLEIFLKRLNSFIEYNTDKSAEHPTNEGEDIVRYSFEKRRVQDKEPVCNN